mgnify:CR=1 FL=1|tara:strand:- start:188 stop:532 length:345 start_codon:yes stop_codon:yes gene_type:complete
MPSITGFKQDAKGLFIEKDPFATLDYTLDFTDWMPAGYTIASLAVTTTNVNGDSTSLVVGSSTHTNYLASAILSGGEAGNVYNVEYRITIAQSDSTADKQDSRNFRVKVLERQI